MGKDIKDMSEEELRLEVKKIRDERSGVGRRRVRQAKTKRMDGVRKEGRKKSDAEAEAKADWV